MASKRLSRSKGPVRAAARAPDRQLAHPVFAQPEPTADPGTFRVNHLRAPQILQKAAAGVDQVVFENYDDINYGYLRIVVTAAQLNIQYHAASDGPNSKAPDDSVTVDLGTRRLTQYSPTDLGQAARVAEVQRLARTAGK